MAAAALATASLAAAPAASAGTRGLSLGFGDSTLTSPDAATRTLWLDRAQNVGAQVVRLELSWSVVAPTLRSASFQPTDPADPAYRWGYIDAAVRDATAHGLQIILLINRAPSWAEGRRRPPSAPAGTWKPDPHQFGLFARAAARRYSGLISGLPAVRRWQVWNEPNVPEHLTPQFSRGRAFSPAWYRRMLNAAYASIKEVSQANVVSTAGTAPYGDPQGTRMPPVSFWRAVLCLRGAALRPARCPHPAHFDALAHHPYPVTGPYAHAISSLDASVPDLVRLARVVRAAQRHHRVLPRGHKRLWATEFAWDSNPPDPDGVSSRLQARWLEQAFYVLWRQGVDTITWFQIGDQPPVPSYPATRQSGVFFRDGRPKPAAQAFRFPFVTQRIGHGRLQAWGRAPGTGGLVVIERRVGAGWRPVRSLHVGAGRVFLVRLRLSSRTVLRARAGGITSLAFAPR